MMRHEDEEAKYDEGDDNREEDIADGSTMLLTVMRKNGDFDCCVHDGPYPAT